MSPHACKVDSSPSLNELSERVCSDPTEKESPIGGGRNSLKPASDQEDRNAALAQWQAAVRRLRLLVEHADEFTPSVFVKKVDESLRELRKAAMRTISDEKEE
jgi:glycyl-tRNA synthetase beta subunit